MFPVHRIPDSYCRKTEGSFICRLSTFSFVTMQPGVCTQRGGYCNGIIVTLVYSGRAGRGWPNEVPRRAEGVEAYMARGCAGTVLDWHGGPWPYTSL
jgi:hypothetical protein